MTPVPDTCAATVSCRNWPPTVTSNVPPADRRRGRRSRRARGRRLRDGPRRTRARSSTTAAAARRFHARRGQPCHDLLQPTAAGRLRRRPRWAPRRCPGPAGAAAGRRVDAEQLVHAADQVARVHRPVLDLLALVRRRADHAAALEAAAGDQGRVRPDHGGRGRRSTAPPIAPSACGRTRRRTRRSCCRAGRGPRGPAAASPAPCPAPAACAAWPGSGPCACPSPA